MLKISSFLTRCETMNSFWILVASALFAAKSLGERSGRHTVNFLHYYNLDEVSLMDSAYDLIIPRFNPILRLKISFKT